MDVVTTHRAMVFYAVGPAGKTTKLSTSCIQMRWDAVVSADHPSQVRLRTWGTHRRDALVQVSIWPWATASDALCQRREYILFFNSVDHAQPDILKVPFHLEKNNSSRS